LKGWPDEQSSIPTVHPILFRFFAGICAYRFVGYRILGDVRDSSSQRKDGPMSTLFGNFATSEPLHFPQQLTERYRPRTIQEFAGLDKPKRICARLAENPRSSAWLFVGPSGTGKTTMALALAELINAEITHVPSQECNLQRITEIRHSCQYAPMFGSHFRLVLIDEADQMTGAAQIALLSMLDATGFPQNTIFIFTANATDRLESRFLSRLQTVEFSSYGIAKDATDLLTRIWQEQAPKDAPAPNFARIVKESNNNVRESLMRLDTELLIA
jgi:replication-associated recombination protein RarA